MPPQLRDAVWRGDMSPRLLSIPGLMTATEEVVLASLPYTGYIPV